MRNTQQMQTRQSRATRLQVLDIRMTARNRIVALLRQTNWPDKMSFVPREITTSQGVKYCRSET